MHFRIETRQLQFQVDLNCEILLGDESVIGVVTQ